MLLCNDKAAFNHRLGKGLRTYDVGETHSWHSNPETGCEPRDARVQHGDACFLRSATTCCSGMSGLRGLIEHGCSGSAPACPVTCAVSVVLVATTPNMRLAVVARWTRSPAGFDDDGIGEPTERAYAIARAPCLRNCPWPTDAPRRINSDMCGHLVVRVVFLRSKATAIATKDLQN